ncbi:SRPBCC domain-containing protein [Paenibacillus sp. HJL G12]|uniref:SRPBCC domain-containing protein n=1 Tax=Paenibacillus dendrobii TaxID=2691084 RepID=A0A7X3II70_9BACL|nr:SRPBCC domain-containing protein [Paenibacillus dendrobii]
MSLKQEIHIDASIPILWKTWTCSDRTTSWLAPAADIEPVVGGKFELFFDSEDKNGMNTAGCKIVGLKEYRQIIFEWKGPDLFAEIMYHPQHLTYVDIWLQPTSDTTTLVCLKHSGWGASTDWQSARAWHEEAWKQWLGNLKTSVESA